jgi:hypothetical protein
MIKKYLIGSSIAASLLLVGCGGGSSDAATSSTTGVSTGYLVDSAVQNADYDCIADGDYNHTTGPDGAFHCNHMERVRFRIGELVLGEIDALPADGYVFPQDLLGVERNATLTEAQVTALAQLLQSLDADRNASNGIVIPDAVKALLEDETFTAENIESYIEDASVEMVPATQAREHVRQTMQALQGVLDGTPGGNHGANGHHGTPADINTTALSTLTPELKDALAHMGNEERLAYDVYYNLYNYHKEASGIEIFQLYNISQNSERTHVGIVQSLVQKYDLGTDELTNVATSVADNTIAFEEMPSGKYDIPEIQSLYDTLYAKGTASRQDALEVGCMVEVVDVNDLDEYIALAEEANASDVADAFTVLRDGSYSHYWAFDKGLKNMGVAEGCCSLGTEYCKPDYPQKSHGR